MLDETKTIHITSPDGPFPPIQAPEVFRQQFGCAIRGNYLCAVDYFGPNLYNVTISTLEPETIQKSEFVDYDQMVNLVAQYGFAIS